MLFEALVLGHVRTAPFRALVTITAIALGVGGTLAVSLTQRTIARSFENAAIVLRSPADLRIVGGETGIDERLLRTVVATPGIREVDPVIETSAVLANRDTVSVVGVDLYHPIPGVSGSGERLPGPFEPSGSPMDPSWAITHHGLVLSTRLARALDIKRGQRVSLARGARTLVGRVAWILPASVRGIDSNVVVVDLATAQELFDMRGLVDRIDCVVAGDAGTVAERLRTRLSTAVRIVDAKQNPTPPAPLQAVEGLAAALFLLMFAFAALVAYAIVDSSIVMRRDDIASARLVGATRRQLFAIFVCEGVAYGACGAFFGALGGSLAAQASVALFGGGRASEYSLWNVYNLSSIASISLFGITVAALAAAAASLVLLRRRLPVDLQGRTCGAISLSRRPLATGMAIAAAALAATLLRPACLGFAAASLVGLAWITAALYAIPLALTAATELADRVAEFSGVPLRLAVIAMHAATRSRITAIATLAVAEAIAVGLATSDASSISALESWTHGALRGDLEVRALDAKEPEAPRGFSPRLIMATRALHGVARVEASQSLADVTVTLRPGTDPYRVRAALAVVFDAYRVQIRSNAGTRASVESLLAPTLVLSGACVALALVTAFVSTATTLSAIVLERSGELRIMRAVGATRATIRDAILIEAAVIACVAAIAGLGGGMASAFAACHLAGPSIPVAVPFVTIVAIVVGCTVIAIVSGVLPARFASRIAADGHSRFV